MHCLQSHDAKKCQLRHTGQFQVVPFSLSSPCGQPPSQPCRRVLIYYKMQLQDYPLTAAPSYQQHPTHSHMSRLHYAEFVPPQNCAAAYHGIASLIAGCYFFDTGSHQGASGPKVLIGARRDTSIVHGVCGLEQVHQLAGCASFKSWNSSCRVTVTKYLSVQNWSMRMGKEFLEHGGRWQRRHK
jgi:hypothetical protein